MILSRECFHLLTKTNALNSIKSMKDCKWPFRAKLCPHFVRWMKRNCRYFLFVANFIAHYLKLTSFNSHLFVFVDFTRSLIRRRCAASIQIAWVFLPLGCAQTNRKSLCNWDPLWIQMISRKAMMFILSVILKRTQKRTASLGGMT